MRTRQGTRSQAITEMCSSYVNALLQQYTAAPEKEWKLKDCAIFLVMALTVRGKVASRSATSTNELVNIQDFYGAHILPELKSPVAAQPVLKADALKFRMQLPKAAILDVMPVVVALLGAESNVVHSYAAHAIAVCENPRNPTFNQYLFESVAVCVYVCAGRICAFMIYVCICT